jgi:hypothetical protein
MDPSGTKPEFHLVAREFSRQHAARSDSHRQAGHHQAGVEFIDVQHLVREQQQVQLKERAQEPEVGDAEHRQPKRTVGKQVFGPGDHFRERVH